MNIHKLIVTLGLAGLLAAAGIEATADSHAPGNTQSGWNAQGSILLDGQTFSMNTNQAHGGDAGSFAGNNGNHELGLSAGHFSGFPESQKVFMTESHGHNHHDDEYHEFVTAVPEPGTFALLLAGLGLVGWGVRRRRQG